MSSFDTSTCSQALAPFIDGFIHDRLLQSMPHVDQTLLQFGDVTNSRLLHPLLHHTPDFIVNRIQIWAVRWPQIWCDEFWSITLKKLKSVSCCVRVHCLVERQRNPRTFHGSQAAVPVTATLLGIHLTIKCEKDQNLTKCFSECY